MGGPAKSPTKLQTIAGKVPEIFQSEDDHLAKTYTASPPQTLQQADGSEVVHPFAWHALKFWAPLFNARHESRIMKNFSLVNCPIDLGTTLIGQARAPVNLLHCHPRGASDW